MKTKLTAGFFPFAATVRRFSLGCLALGLVLAESFSGAAPLATPGFTTLHSFTEGFNCFPCTNVDGATPQSAPISSGGILYGTTRAGGRFGNGTVFKVNSDGTAFTALHHFAAHSGSPPVNNGGAHPQAGVILSGNSLYGTAYDGGSAGRGTVFKINTNGTGFTTLHHFTAASGDYPYGNSDGAKPYGALVVSGNTLYGTAQYGGSSDNGAVFRVNTDGTDFANLHSFALSFGQIPSVNDEGANPQTGLHLVGSFLYGTAFNGGNAGWGSIFAIRTDGAGFTNLHNFSNNQYSTNGDGANPFGSLISADGKLYGTAYYGGSSGNGTVFAISTNGTGFTNLHSFSALAALTNSDGANPVASLILSGDILYGTTSVGGDARAGTMFAINKNTTEFKTLHSFTEAAGCFPCTNEDGANPRAGLYLENGVLYGTAANGGGSGNGTVFSLLLLPPSLTIARSGSNVILRWPTSAIGFTLQSTTNLVEPIFWGSNLFSPVIVNGQNTVTNVVSGTAEFYRLVL